MTHSFWASIIVALEHDWLSKLWCSEGEAEADLVSSYSFHCTCSFLLSDTLYKHISILSLPCAHCSCINCVNAPLSIDMGCIWHLVPRFNGSSFALSTKQKHPCNLWVFGRYELFAYYSHGSTKTWLGKQKWRWLKDTEFIKQIPVQKLSLGAEQS